MDGGPQGSSGGQPNDGPGRWRHRHRWSGRRRAQNNGGALLGKIGENGTPFLIGDQYEATPDVEGKLFLQIGPSPWGCDSTGKYDLVIKRGT